MGWAQYTPSLALSFFERAKAMLNPVMQKKMPAIRSA